MPSEHGSDSSVAHWECVLHRCKLPEALQGAHEVGSVISLVYREETGAQRSKGPRLCSLAVTPQAACTHDSLAVFVINISFARSLRCQLILAERIYRVSSSLLSHVSSVSQVRK